MDASKLADELKKINDKETERFKAMFGELEAVSFNAGFYACQVAVMELLIKGRINGNHDLPQV